MLVIMEPEIEDYSLPTYKTICNVMKARADKIVFRRVRKRIKAKRSQYYKFPVLKPNELNGADLLIVFSPYATSHKAKLWSQKYNIRLLHLEQGFLRKSVLCDIGGFWGESYIYLDIKNILNNISQKKASEWFDLYTKYVLKNNISKRPQPNKYKKHMKRFIFLPMQYMNDQSVLRFGNMPYPRFMGKVAKFCKRRKIDLLIKKHPHAYRKEIKNVNRAIRRVKKIHSRTFVVNGPIHRYCQDCLVMAGMNTGTIVDGLINNTIMTHCGQSIFENSGAVIHDNNVMRGLEGALTIKKCEDIYLQQKRMLYFLYHNYLLLEEQPFIPEYSNEQKLKRQLEF
jgi:hypothetical protein